MARKSKASAISPAEPPSSATGSTSLRSLSDLAVDLLLGAELFGAIAAEFSRDASAEVDGDGFRLIA